MWASNSVGGSTRWSSTLTRMSASVSIGPSFLAWSGMSDADDLAAVDRDGLPGEPGGVVGQEERHGAAEVLGRAQALDRHLREQARLVLLGHHLAGGVREDGPRRDRVDADVHGRQLHRETGGEA